MEAYLYLVGRASCFAYENTQYVEDWANDLLTYDLENLPAKCIPNSQDNS